MDKLLSAIIDEFKSLSIEKRRAALIERRNHDIAATLRHIEEVSDFARTISMTLERLFQRAPIRVRDEDFECYNLIDNSANDEHFALAA